MAELDLAQKRQILEQKLLKLRAAAYELDINAFAVEVQDASNAASAAADFRRQARNAYASVKKLEEMLEELPVECP
jgi:hypothetical protein